MGLGPLWLLVQKLWARWNDILLTSSGESFSCVFMKSFTSASGASGEFSGIPEKIKFPHALCLYVQHSFLN